MIPKEARPKKKHKNKTKAQPLSFSSLPDELVENILARISKWKYPNLSLVSKRFLSILSSPELYKTRFRIGTTEPCLYFCLEDSPNISPPKWFTLRMKSANETLTQGYVTHRDYSLVPVPSIVGSDIYLIGGPSNGPPSSLVRILDCRSHTWRDGPSMSVARAGASAYFIHGKIYVMERCRNNDDNWMEELDVETQTWSPLLSHGATEFRRDWFMIKVFRGKLYAIGNKNYAYDRNEGTWEVVENHNMRFQHIPAAWCEIKNVMYSYTSDGSLRYSYNRRKWIKVEGWGFQLLRSRRRYKLSGECVLGMRNYGGKLLVMWSPGFEENNGKSESRIWCAKIALEGSRNGVWGSVEWVNEVITVTSSYKFLSCVVSWI
ncbi:hypothetical protein Bca52824_095546 [Brassica carinata]|uniref:F-box domain-containing protein n=1 Tax=Brassica carinata TaxID=52824 RepID=A0A8X7TI60_BRACI|nr:hypothetical protein Bca52824_095546 [Brassica carinata]